MNVPFKFFVAVAKLDIPGAGKVRKTSVKAKVIEVQKLGKMTQAGMSSEVV